MTAPTPGDPDRGGRPLVSVVIATHERPDLLLRCVTALVAQEFDRSAYEVIVVDDGSAEGARRATEAALARLADGTHGAGNATTAVAARASNPTARPIVRYVYRPRNAGPAAARNVGWRMARGAVIAFTDDDTVPLADWLREGLAALGRGFDAVGGRIEVPLPDVPTDYELDAAGLEQAVFATANCFVRRPYLEATGGFDERFRSAWREDTDLHFSLQARGARMGMAPAARVVHPVRPAHWGVSLAQQRKVMFDALLYKKFPQWYRAYVRRTPPWTYYAIVAAGTWSLAAAAQGNARATLAGLAVWIALAVRFALRRLARTSRNPSHVAEMAWTSLWIPWLSVYWRLRGAMRFRVWFV